MLLDLLVPTDPSDDGGSQKVEILLIGSQDHGSSHTLSSFRIPVLFLCLCYSFLLLEPSSRETSPLQALA